MRRLIISNSQADFTSHAGLGLVGMALERCTNLAVEAKAVAAVRTDAMPHQTMLASYVGLLCLGKSDFDAIDAFRTDPFFLHALGLERAPSAAILRQRLDAHADAFKDVVITATIEFLCRSGARITPLANGLVPLDADVTPFDNGKTKKEGVSRTYKGSDGFAPIGEKGSEPNGTKLSGSIKRSIAYADSNDQETVEPEHCARHSRLPPVVPQLVTASAARAVWCF